MWSCQRDPEDRADDLLRHGVELPRSRSPPEAGAALLTRTVSHGGSERDAEQVGGGARRPRRRPRRRRWRRRRGACRGRRRARPAPRRERRRPPRRARHASSRSRRLGHRRLVPLPRGAVVLPRRSSSRIAAGSDCLAQVATNTRLPSDFDIFSPSIRTIAWCIQWRTNGSPVAASDCAVSHSWCGKIRSVPPPCRSIVVPSSRSASAEHSMCQPGRPGPHSDSHDGSSVERRLPQHEVERVALVRVVGVAAVLGRERQHLVARAGGST